MRLGTRDLGSFLTGGLDEVAIYPRKLTAAEVQETLSPGNKVTLALLCLPLESTDSSREIPIC